MSKVPYRLKLAHLCQSRAPSSSFFPSITPETKMFHDFWREIIANNGLKAEKILQKCPSLACLGSGIFDQDGCGSLYMTAYQYALYVGSKSISKMMLKYLTPDQVRCQQDGFEVLRNAFSNKNHRI